MNFCLYSCFRISVSFPACFSLSFHGYVSSLSRHLVSLYYFLCLSVSFPVSVSVSSYLSILVHPLTLNITVFVSVPLSPVSFFLSFYLSTFFLCLVISFCVFYFHACLSFLSLSEGEKTTTNANSKTNWNNIIIKPSIPHHHRHHHHYFCFNNNKKKNSNNKSHDTTLILYNNQRLFKFETKSRNFISSLNAQVFLFSLSSQLTFTFTLGLSVFERITRMLS